MVDIQFDEQDLQPEQESATPAVAVVLGPSASRSLLSQVGAYNAVVQGINALHRSFEYRTAHPPDPDASTTFAETSTFIDKVRQVRTAMLVARRNATQPYAEEYAGAMDTVTRGLPQSETATRSKRPLATIVVHNATDLAILNTKLKGILHDFSEPFTSWEGALDVQQRSGDTQYTRTELDTLASETVTALKEKLDRATEILVNRYPTELLTARRMADMLGHYRTALAAQEVALILPDSLPDDAGSVRWHSGLLEDLMDNIAQNTVKTYRSQRYKDKVDAALEDEDAPFPVRELKVNFVKGQDETGRQVLDVQFDDQGPGFLPDDPILQLGFQSGLSRFAGDARVGGTGEGMAYHAFLLAQKAYDGRLIPQNIVDINGQVVGARITVRLPLAP